RRQSARPARAGDQRRRGPVRPAGDRRGVGTVGPRLPDRTGAGRRPLPGDGGPRPDVPPDRGLRPPGPPHLTVRPATHTHRTGAGTARPQRAPPPLSGPPRTIRWARAPERPAPPSAAGAPGPP